MISIEEQKMRTAILTGAQIMIDNGLGDWKLKFSNRRTALADCSIRRKTIRFSKHFVMVADKDQFVGVAFHEVTHALLPKEVHHGAEFVRKCIEISPNADYARRSVELPICKYKLTCPECKIEGGCNRPTTGICRRCNKAGKRTELLLVKNILKIVEW